MADNSTTPAPGLQLAARTVPWPTSISAAARNALADSSVKPAGEWPAEGDEAAWLALCEVTDNAMAASVEAALPPDAAIETRTIDGVTVYVARPDNAEPDDRRVYVDIHGGGLYAGRGRYARASAWLRMAQHGVEAVSIDYRMPPRHPFPAGLEDCLAVYRALVAEHGAENIIVGGGSAGGNLAAALLLRAREERLPMPAALVLQTPEVDLTESGDSFETLMGLDPVLPFRLTPANRLYAAGQPLEAPLLSPLFGDLRGFPPTLLQSGTRDLFLSNTVRMHRALRAAGVAAELHVFEAMPHGGFFGGAPEDEERELEIAHFVRDHWAR